MNDYKQTSPIDFTIIFVVVAFGIISCYTLYTINPYLGAVEQGSYMKQIVWYVIGAVGAGFMMILDYDRLHQIVWAIYGFGVTMLLMIFFKFPPGIVHYSGGAWSWFKFPGIGTIQPSEFMKVFLVITLAHVIVRHNEKNTIKTIKSDLLLLLKIVILAIIPMALIAVQPDLGTFLVLASITGFMILISGIQWRILLSILSSILLVVGVVALMFIFNFTKVTTFLEESVFAHVDSRFYGWLQPEKYEQSAGLQLIKSITAIGSGQLTGKGPGNFEVMVPERHTDMIFTAISEQFGFVGSSIVVTLFFLLVYRMIQIALESNDAFGSYLIVGVVAMIVFQVFQNIGMSIQLLPITGLPLPFLSYGGSSTLAYLLAIGIVLNIKSRTRTYMFE
ncbi:rod shape-determining protein RodA [Halobacillus yeomjeoni]|uniref:FtsW/RodA/SpoVE family cell cycle protein n=1 Tax=Halobacillus yeomjeoni TaxID=311194 RepID=UPI001CD7C3E5|nr:FtsW/RodA/SpoVE family cell cycle protein [Halobacillus yeomjeoni]MCA0983789.1 rod shape-determining protein RodA [Halobacillus yeomjeoni]